MVAGSGARLQSRGFVGAGRGSERTIKELLEFSEGADVAARSAALQLLFWCLLHSTITRAGGHTS